MIPLDTDITASQGILGENLNTTNEAVNSLLRLIEPPITLVVTTGACPIDWSQSNCFILTLSANITSMSFSDAIPGQTINIRLTNTASNYTVVWPSGVQWIGGIAPVMTIGAKSDIYTIFYDGTDYFGSAIQNLS